VFCGIDPTIERKNPNALDAAMEPIIQNTAYVMSLTRPMSEVDKNQSRYSIIGDAKSYLQAEKAKKEVYSRDKEAYYPYVDTNKPEKRYEAPKLDRPKVTGEAKSYYDPTGDYRVIPKFYPGKEVPIVVGDTRTTFPSETNLKSLKNQLKVINYSSNMDVDAIHEKGIYFPDPKAYYDPTEDDTHIKVTELNEKIKNMSSSLDTNMRNTLKADISVEKQRYEVQNMVNKEAEEMLLKHKSIYTPIENRNGVTTEFPPGSNVGKNKNKRKAASVVGGKEEADVISHTYVEAEEKPRSSTARAAAAPAPAVAETQAKKDSIATNNTKGESKEGKMSNKDRSTKLADPKIAVTTMSGNVLVGTNKMNRTNNLRKGDDEIKNSKKFREPVMTNKI